MSQVQKKKQPLSADQESAPGSSSSPKAVAKGRPAGKSVAGKGVGKKSRDSAVRGRTGFLF